MGRSREDIESRWMARIAKTTSTNLSRGHFTGDKNPASRKRMLEKGLSENEVAVYLSEKAKAGITTKRKLGYFDNKVNNPYSMDYWVSRGLTVEQAKNKVASRIHNRPEFWLRRGYSLEDAKKLASESAATNSLAAKIRRWGDREGQQKYLLTRERLRKNWSPKSASGSNFSSSKQANKFFVAVYKLCRRSGLSRDDLVFKLNRGEWFLRDGENIFFYDFLIKPLKLILEFNGEHVHPNKNVLTQEQWKSWRHAYSKKYAEEVYQYDQQKIEFAEKLGYNVLVVWSKDKDALPRTLTLIKEMLDGHQNHQAQR
jgi:very-short-patch-repair endonuclease